MTFILTNVTSILSEMPDFISFNDRLKWLENEQSKLSEGVQAHSTNVARLSSKLAKNLGYDDSYVVELYLAARWHDIGKIATPIDILNKPSGFNKNERSIMEQHALDGVLLLGANAPKIWLEVAEFHHERYDGFGYNHLKGENIPISARLVSIADTFDALTQKRVYKDGMGIEKALKLMTGDTDIAKFGRRSFDPIFLRAFVKDFINDSNITFSTSGFDFLQDYVNSDPMNDFYGEKFNNDGWELKANGDRFKYCMDHGEDCPVESYLSPKNNLNLGEDTGIDISPKF